MKCPSPVLELQGLMTSLLTKVLLPWQTVHHLQGPGTPPLHHHDFYYYEQLVTLNPLHSPEIPSFFDYHFDYHPLLLLLLPVYYHHQL